MAADGTIFVEIDPTGAVSGAKRVKRSLDSVGASADKLGKKTGRLKSSLAEISRGLIGPLGLAAAAAAVVVAFRSVLAIAGKFEKAVAELSAITGAAGADLKVLSDEARRLGKTTTSSAVEVATAFKLIASAKPELLENRDALIEVSKQAIVLAEASGLELPLAVKALTGSLNQFNAPAEEAGRFINVLAAGSKLGAKEIPLLTQSLKVAGTIAAGAGLSFEETVAAIEVLGEAELEGAEAGTQLRNTLLRLNKLGVEALSPSVVGLSQALKNLEATQLSGLSVLERNLRLEKIFGAETIAGASALLVRAQRVEDLTKAVTGTNTAFEQQLIATDTLEDDLIRLDNAFEGLSLSLSMGVIPNTRDATTFMADYLNVISDGIDDINQLGVAIGEGLGGAFRTNEGVLRSLTDASVEQIDIQIEKQKELIASLKESQGFAASLQSFSIFSGLGTALNVGEIREAERQLAKLKSLGDEARGIVAPDDPVADEAAAAAAAAAAAEEAAAAKALAKARENAAREAERAAQKQQRSFLLLTESLNPLEASLNDLNEAEATLQKQQALGLITKEEEKILQGQLTEAFRASLDPIGALNAKLAEEKMLAALSNEEMAITARVQREVNALKKAGVEDAESHADAIRKEVVEIDRLKDIQTENATKTVEVNEALELQKTILEEIRGPQEDMNERLMALSGLLARDAITIDEFNTKLQELRNTTLEGQTGVEAGFERGFIKAQENLNDFASLSEKIVVDSFQGMEDAAVNFAKTGKLEVGSLVDSILADFVRLQIRQSFANALGSSGGKDGGSGILGLVGGLFSSSSNPNGPPGTSGGSATSGSGSTFANLASLAGSLFASNQEGGIERQPTISTLAEKGPEAIIPLKGGSVPVEIKESLKPPINITNVFNISTPDVQGFGRSTGQVGSMMGTAMQSALARNS